MCQDSQAFIQSTSRAYRFRDGTRNGADAALMKPAVDRLTGEDIVNLSAYLGSLVP